MMPSNCSNPMTMMMMMYFHLGFDDTLLIKGWKAHNVGEFFGSLVFFFLMAAMYEGLKYFREILLNFAMKKRKERKSKVDTVNDVRIDERETSLLIHTNVNARCWQKITKMNTVEHVLHITQTFLHMVQVAVGYLLMLVVMTYNLWLFFAVVLGAGLGYLVFGRLRMVHAPHTTITDDHCN